MQAAITPYSVILLLGSAHGLFLMLALLNARGGNVAANRFLALLTLAFALDLGDEFLEQAGYYAYFPHLSALEEAINFLPGPFAYLYVCALTSSQGFRLAGRRWLHFLPFLASFVLLAPYLTLDADQKLAWTYGSVDVDNPHIGLAQLGLSVATLLNLVQIGTYIGISIRRLTRHARDIRETFSYSERVSLTWLRNVLISLSLLYALYLFGALFADTLGVGQTIEQALYLAIAMCIYGMGYLGLRQPVIFARAFGNVADHETDVVEAASRGDGIETAEPGARKKYERSALDPNLSKALLGELEALMKTAQPYLESGLTLPELAARLEISPNYLSQVINEQTGCNFFDYVNQHRVEAARRALADPAQARASILTIALDAGFNSKSSFYTAFRKHTGMTAGQYRKEATPADQVPG